MDMDGRQGAIEQTDALLMPFLSTVDEEESKRLFEHLVSHHADQLIKIIIRRELNVSLEQAQFSNPEPDNNYLQDAKDAYGDVIANLLNRLCNLKTVTNCEGISNFRNYVAVTTQNICYDYLRRRHPQRWRLRNRLRYLLTHREEFAIWESDGEELLCGLATWWGLNKSMSFTEAYGRALLSKKDLASGNPTDLVTAIFKQVGEPLKLEDLVNIVADLWGLGERDKPKDHREAINKDQERVGQATFVVRTELQVYMRQLWLEICQLPVKQRSVILLSLRTEDGEGLALFPYSGIATIRQIAEALETSYEEVSKIWKDLPWEDATIAQKLGITRQQVINLRKTARERLSRRMKALYG
jgi:RNA polymerase sigma factor (sigma-70 family)